MGVRCVGVCCVGVRCVGVCCEVRVCEVRGLKASLVVVLGCGVVGLWG